MFALLRSNADVRSLFIAQVVSFMGDWFAYVAFVGLVQSLVDSPVLVTLVYVAQALPAFFMSAVAGSAADRFDRRRIIQLVSIGQVVAAAGLLLVDSRATLAIGFGSLCVISALGSFVGPAAQAGLPNLVRTPEELQKGSLLFGSLWGAMLAIGAGLGGLFAATFGRDAAFIANAVSFAIACVCVTMIKRPMQQRATDSTVDRPPMRPIEDMTEAFRYARRHTVVLALLSSKASFAMGAGIVGLLAVLSKKEFGGDDAATGLLLGARGVGVALGPLIASRLVGPDLSRVLLMCGSAGLVFGTCYLGLSVVPALWMASILVLIAHLSGGAQWTLSTYGLQASVPDSMRGRILAGDFGFTMLIITISNLAAGLLAGVIGPRAAIATFAVLGLVAGSVYLTLTRPIRKQLGVEASAALASRPGRATETA
jgi:MFS family permease